MSARRLVLAILTLAVAGCSSGPPPEPPAPVFDPGGTWSFSADVQGQALQGTMRITGSEDEGWSGRLSSEMGETVMGAVRVDGTTLRFSLPDFEADGRLVFEGDTFSGEIGTEMGGIPISGTRR
jgi:hypothetical protein